MMMVVVVVVVVMTMMMMMMMQWNMRINGLLYQWLQREYNIVSSIVSIRWLCLSFRVCSKTLCEFLLQTV
jgi:hypothetical protein